MITLEHLKEPFDSTSDYHSLASTFLLVFSRFEFALKSKGYATMQGPRLMVKWRKFEDENSSAFDTSQNATADYLPLITSPPSRQTLDGDVFGWNEEPPRVPSDADLKWLLEMVYRVRNNLFHGGKWPTDGNHSADLIKSSMLVIAKCLEFHPPLNRAYFTTDYP
jgi:hypothetical protein